MVHCLLNRLLKAAEVHLVAVDQGDEEEQRAERDGTGEHGFDQQHCPTTQEEDVDEQPENTDKRRIVSCNVEEQNL